MENGLMFSFLSTHKNQSQAAIVSCESGISIVTIAPATDESKKPQLQLCEFSPWQEGMSQQEFLLQKSKQYSLEKHDCSTVMGLGEYSVLSVDAPDVPPNELRAAVRWQIKDLIDFHVDDAVIDVFDSPSSATHGQKNKLYVVVSRLSAVRERVDALQDAEANLTTIDIPEMVLRNIMAHLPENDAGVAMVYLTRERGLIVVARNDALYFARTLDLGYDSLIESVNAAAIAGSEGLETNNIAFDKLVLEVQRSLDYYDRYFSQPPVAGLVLAPTAESVLGLSEYLNEALGLPVRHLDIHEVVECETALTVPQQAQCLPAIGAALRQERTTL
jgi:MSHA biogenesis protein MshI